MILQEIASLPDGDSLPPPLRLHGIVFQDVHHNKCVLGGLGKFETRVYQNDQGVPTHPPDGGMLPQRRLTTTTKFALETRGCLGVAVRKNPDGSLTGVKAEPFNDTERTILGIKSFQKALDDEYNRVNSL